MPTSDGKHRSFPKPTPHVQDRVQQRRKAMQAWLECCAFVDQRDRYRCRCCGRRTRQTLTLCPERREHHHLVGRNVAPGLVCDPRNVITVCLECHDTLTRHDIRVEGCADSMFTSDGQQYLNADHRLHFTPAESAAG